MSIHEAGAAGAAALADLEAEASALDAADARSGRTARAQVLLGSDQALLLCYRQRRWYLEGVYE